MSNKAKKRTLDIIGALISFLLPAAAAVAEFPRVQESATGANQWLTILNISASAFAIITIIGAITLWRFCRHRLRLPHSGLALSVIFYAIAYGVERFIHSFVVILGWSVIGCAVAWVLYFIADKKYGGST